MDFWVENGFLPVPGEALILYNRATDNTGVLFSTETSDRKAYMAFDNNESTYWFPGWNYLTGDHYIGLDLYTLIGKSSQISKCEVTMFVQGSATYSVSLQGSNDGEFWESISETISFTASTSNNKFSVLTNKYFAYKYVRFKITGNFGSTNNWANAIIAADFYGIPV